MKKPLIALVSVLLLSAPIDALSQDDPQLSTFDALTKHYLQQRESIAPIIPPILLSSLDFLENMILKGDFSFQNLDGWYFSWADGPYPASGELADYDGQTLIIYEDLSTSSMKITTTDGKVVATFKNEPFPNLSALTGAAYDSAILAELNKRSVALWVSFQNAKQEEAATSSYSPPELNDNGSGYSMMMSGGGGSGTLNDLDGDGVPNRDEIVAGTDPENFDDYFHVTQMTWSTNSNAILHIRWSGITNREYSVENLYGEAALLGVQNWGVLSQGIAGLDADIVYTQDMTEAAVTTGFFRVQVKETDANGNGLPDWWEIENFGGLTNILATGDEDGDGLDNLEEFYYGYSPTNSERILYHSVFHVVEVSTNDPAGSDDGTERFDFHGGGRPLSLASNATDVEYVGIYGQASSGGIYFNNDQSNLYIGISGLFRGSDNAFILFIDSGSGGVTNLSHLAGKPYALGIANNIGFNATDFTPNVACLVGGNYADGMNYHDYNIGTKNFGQGVYELGSSSNISDFAGFNTSGGCPISQWSTNATSDESPRKGIEIAIGLSALGVSPGDTIRAAGVFIGGEDGTNRYVINEAYGKRITGSGYGSVTLIGSEVQLSDVKQTLPSQTYPGFTDDDVLLQAFYWDVPQFTWWTNLAAKVSELSSAGFTIAWLPVPYKCANASGSSGYDPFDHYDLGEYYQRDSIPTRYGTKAQLTNLIAGLLSMNIKPVCDIVLNHMAGGGGADNKTYDYPHNTFEKTAADFHPSTQGHNDQLYPYHNNWGFAGAGDNPVDVAFLAPNMRLGFKKWGSWLVTNVNYKAFRFDFTEGVEPWFLWEWLNYPAQRSSFAFMEYWEEADGEDMLQWLELTGRSAAIYDWHLRNQFLKPMCEGNGSFDMTKLEAPSLLGLEPNYTVVFVDNHDTWREGYTNKLGIVTNKPMAYAYAFHSQGLPMVFYHDYFEKPYLTTNAVAFGTPLTNEINRLIRIRKVAVAGAVQVLHADTDLFIQLRSGSDTDSASILALNDNPSSNLFYTVQTPWTNMCLVDLVSGGSVTNTDGSGYATLGAPPSGYRIYAPTNVLTQVEN